VNKELLEFPCSYEIRAFGAAAADFEATIKALVLRHTLSGDIIKCVSKPSRNGRFLVVRCTIMARDREQLTLIYTTLKHSEQVLTVL